MNLGLIREIPPTAGWPVNIINLLPPLFKRVPKGTLEEDFRKYLGAEAALLTYSGTAALYLILESIKSVSGKKTVVIPAFICPLVPLAIKRAGLNVLACDINPDNLDFDMKQLRGICAENKDVLAVIAVHLAGIPAVMDEIFRAAENNDILIIEDCAQSLGAEYKGRKTGTLGDFSFFSLCRGKGLTIYEGGLAVTNKPRYARLLKDTYARICGPDISSESLKIAEMFAYSIFYRPALFWFAFRMPQIFWKICGDPVRAIGDYFEMNFPTHKVSRFREHVGHINFPRLDMEIQKQREKADFYIKRLQAIPGITVIKEPEQAKANYPYITLIFNSEKKRDRALKILGNTGLGISQIYLQAITDYAYLKGLCPGQECGNARRIAAQSITLSTSCFLKEKEMTIIVEPLKKL